LEVSDETSFRRKFLTIIFVITYCFLYVSFNSIIVYKSKKEGKETLFVVSISIAKTSSFFKKKKKKKKRRKRSMDVGDLSMKKKVDLITVIT